MNQTQITTLTNGSFNLTTAVTAAARAVSKARSTLHYNHRLQLTTFKDGFFGGKAKRPGQH